MRQTPQTYAITSVAYGRRSIFQSDTIVELLIATLFRYRDAGRYKLHAFVVMPNHLHVLLTPALNDTVEKIAQLIKGGFSFAVRKDFPGEVWQPGYHAHRVTDEADLYNQAAYIESNPARKHLNGHAHIHTAKPYADRIDLLPRTESPRG